MSQNSNDSITFGSSERHGRFAFIILDEEFIRILSMPLLRHQRNVIDRRDVIHIIGNSAKPIEKLLFADLFGNQSANVKKSG
jgi:hypothetical protein